MPKKRIQNDFGEFKEFLHRPITDSKNLNKRKFLIHFQTRIDLYYIIIPKGKQIQFHILQKEDEYIKQRPCFEIVSNSTSK